MRIVYDVTSMTGRWPFGSQLTHDQANYGAPPRDDDRWGQTAVEGRDRWAFSAPVGSFPPNAFGLYDMTGNVWERLDDCFNPTYSGAPNDGSAWLTGNCEQRVQRGASWGYEAKNARLAARGRNDKSFRVAGDGFRVARVL